MTQSSDKSGVSVTDVLIGSGALGAYFSALIFVIGWSYAQSYFGILGITLTGDGGSGFSSEYAARALPVIYHYLAWIFVVALFLCVFIILVLQFPQYFSPKFSDSTRLVLILFIVTSFVIGSFTSALWMGGAYGRTEIFDLITNDKFPSVILNINKDNPFTNDLRRMAEKDCLRKVFMDNKYIYVYPAYESLIKHGRTPQVYSIGLTLISSIELSPPTDEQSSTRQMCTP